MGQDYGRNKRVTVTILQSKGRPPSRSLCFDPDPGTITDYVQDEISCGQESKVQLPKRS